MTHDDTPILVLTTVPAAFEWSGLARALVEQRLAACVGVLPTMTSIYRWQDAIESAEERQLLIKTTRARLSALEAAIRAGHPYEVPELLVVPVEGGGAAYVSWLRDETRVRP